MFCKHLTPLLLLAWLPALNLAGERTTRSDWPQFRGPRAAGVADGEKLPAKWDLEKRTNILWKTAVPGLGHASPIVVGNRVFIATAQSAEKDPQLRVGLYGDIDSVPTELSHTWRLTCLCKHTGRVLWRRSLHVGVPQVKRHTKASHANSTPASDGFHVVVFLGSEGLYCYDRCGNRLWRKDLGLLDSGYYVAPDAQWGFGSSPIIYKNMVIVQCDVQKGSFIAAFDVRSGRELWRTAREDVPTWSTPTIFEGKTRT
ncbi:MAG TPA: PQQ-binding-like beta-propeller repeat protein, partial [Lacipirellulaceae bacterium]|nr:PQQ-binding-like beta-propeller repeat protein [Lacipirellulaceae bacterium]